MHTTTTILTRDKILLLDSFAGDTFSPKFRCYFPVHRLFANYTSLRSTYETGEAYKNWKSSGQNDGIISILISNVVNLCTSYYTRSFTIWVYPGSRCQSWMRITHTAVRNLSRHSSVVKFPRSHKVRIVFAQA